MRQIHLTILVLLTLTTILHAQNTGTTEMRIKSLQKEVYELSKQTRTDKIKADNLSIEAKAVYKEAESLKKTVKKLSRKKKRSAEDYDNFMSANSRLLNMLADCQEKFTQSEMLYKKISDNYRKIDAKQQEIKRLQREMYQY